MGHTVPDRDQQLAAAWPWVDDYPLHDRQKLAAYFEKVGIRRSTTDSIAIQVPLPGDRFFGQPRLDDRQHNWGIREEW